MGPTDKVVILIDMDCFYCQVEEKLNPLLKDKPIAVVQYNAWRGGGIIAVNYPARDEGVTRHMRGNEAKKKCPSIKLVQVPEVRGKADLTKYRDAGQEVANVLATFTPLLQRASVDEAYLDITEAVEKRIAASLDDLNVSNLANSFVVGSDLPDFLHNVLVNREFTADNLKLAMGGLICEEIRHEVFKQTGYKCSAGIAHNKILAKLVCSLHKPDKQTILPQDAVEKFFETIPIRKITSLGGKFGQSLSDDFHITYMSQLREIPQKHLMQKYDEKTAHWLYNIARGVDKEPVTAKLMSKSIACCKNLPGVTALKTSEAIEQWLQKLSEELSERLEKDLRENNRKAKQIVVSFVQEINKNDVHSSRTHPLVSYNPQKICCAAFEVIKKFCLRSDGNYHVKHLGLSAGHFEDVKKVREITSFFQVGHKDHQKNTRQESVHETKCSITDENCDPESNEIIEQNIYCQLTQPLEENTYELIFYDDSCRVKSTNLKQWENNTLQSDYSESRSPKESDVDNNLIAQSAVILKSNKPSFFTKYFDNDASTSNICATYDDSLNSNLPVATEDPFASEMHLESSDTSIPSDVETPLFETCNECKKLISVTELESHQDYHLALKLSKEETIPQRPIAKTTPDKKRGRPKSVKRKAENGNSLMIFFKKDDADPTVGTETCSECHKKIKIEEISSHMDYHTAKKIHLEINSIKSSVHTVKSSKTKNSKAKNQTSNRSVTSFFRPA